jgi:hypothetical protein
MYQYLEQLTFHYSRLSNKHEVRLTEFEKLHPPQKKNPPSTFIDFLDFFTLHSSFIRVMYILFCTKKTHPPLLFPTSTFIKEMRVSVNCMTAHGSSKCNQRIMQCPLLENRTYFCDATQLNDL